MQIEDRPDTPPPITKLGRVGVRHHDDAVPQIVGNCLWRSRDLDQPVSQRPMHGELHHALVERRDIEFRVRIVGRRSVDDAAGMRGDFLLALMALTAHSTPP